MRKPRRRKQAEYKEKKAFKELKIGSKLENIFLNTVFIICFISACYSGTQIIKWNIYNHENAEIIKKISSSFTAQELADEKEKYSIDFEGLKNINPDTVGWLKVYGTDIEFPVVQSADNEYYLTHNFKNKNNAAGWAFADFRNKFDGTDKNIIIYGHNRKDGSMFASLNNIMEDKWYKNDANRLVVFITENEYNLYEVFSVYQILKEDYYISTDFEKLSYSDFIKRTLSKSIYNFGIDVDENDEILTLSTCASNSKYRIVLQAKKVVEVVE